jgi:hypothetical protein
MPPKPEVIVDLDPSAPTSLLAESYLSCLKDGVSYHETLDTRHPLGIYNVSTNRILKKIRRCCHHLEWYLIEEPTVSALRHDSSRQEELVDYIELCLYAAAEHVDDVEAIADCFFKDKATSSKSIDVRQLKSSMKSIRDRVSAFTNAIKHSQSRIRLFSYDFEQDKGSVCLHGFFLEAHHSGKVGPSPIFHSTERVISVTSFLWDILLYLLQMSGSLCNFLEAMDVVEKPIVRMPGSQLLRSCIVSLVRLPIYSYDEAHPFERCRFVLRGSDDIERLCASGIYGSLLRPWSRSPFMSMGRLRQGYEGDGTTKSFEIVSPKNMRIQHWE